MTGGQFISHSYDACLYTALAVGGQAAIDSYEQITDDISASKVVGVEALFRERVGRTRESNKVKIERRYVCAL